MSADVMSDPAELRLPRVDAFRKARSHSRRVKVLKLVLPVAALTMAGAFVYVSFQASPSDMLISAANSAIEKNQLVMANPRLEGFAKDGRPFTVDASRAIQGLENDKIINLDAINARLPLDNGWINVTAPAGVYDRTRNMLDIRGDTADAIKVVSSNNSTVSMRSAVIDMTSGTLRATDSVDMKQQGGAIAAEQLDVSKGGKVLVFEKKVRVTLDPGSQASGDGNANP